MASAAAAMKEKGFEVTGSDTNVYPPMSTFLADRVNDSGRAPTVTVEGSTSKGAGAVSVCVMPSIATLASDPAAARSKDCVSYARRVTHWRPCGLSSRQRGLVVTSLPTPGWPGD